MVEFESKKVGDKYRILRACEHLPEEVSQKEVNEILSSLRTSLENVCVILRDVYERYDVVSNIVEDVFSSGCLNYDEGEEWHLKYIANEIREVEEYLATQNDDVLSYEDSETIFDDGYQEEWHRSEIYSKVIEDTGEKEVVREIILKYEEPIYRERVTLWELVPGGRHSKNISYIDLPMDDRITRLIKNTKRNMK